MQFFIVTEAQSSLLKGIIYLVHMTMQKATVVLALLIVFTITHGVLAGDSSTGYGLVNARNCQGILKSIIIIVHVLSY